ncbi:hypothetical protein QR680_011420 [Steinernema hermaphroditum]|uniref:Uncharacterized protein n=1 Tax=Steinernema hermaphroditum TaxID=289476 RepID=A0AA39LYX8_9BILA|nr:hypothetical protein QR680_011420 [Steinernema hermaphroditum]
MEAVEDYVLKALDMLRWFRNGIFKEELDVFCSYVDNKYMMFSQYEFPSVFVHGDLWTNKVLCKTEDGSEYYGTQTALKDKEQEVPFTLAQVLRFFG